MEENNIKNLSDFLYYTRVYIYHCSQETAAQMICVSKTYYNSLENGKMNRRRTSYEVIKRIARWAGKSPDYVNLLKKGRKRTIE